MGKINVERGVINARFYESKENGEMVQLHAEMQTSFEFSKLGQLVFGILNNVRYGVVVPEGWHRVENGYAAKSDIAHRLEHQNRETFYT